MAKQTGAGADGNRRYPGEVALGGKWSKSAGPETPDAERKPMVTPSLRASLTKQGYTIVGLGLGLEVGVGSLNPNPNPNPNLTLTLTRYKIVGSHSGVKLCRWTKAMLRGRGGCYKHTFYGIVSYQCMEATPSLACANKCRATSHPNPKPSPHALMTLVLP